MDNSKILVFDSGKGGLNVLKTLLKMPFFADYYYLSDSVFAPYGDRSKAFLLARSRFLLEKYAEGFAAVVLACNTLSTVVGRDLEKTFSIPIFGVRPMKPRGKTLLLCTPATAASERVKNMRSDPALTVCAPKGLVAAIEKNIYNILKGDFSSAVKFFPENEGYDSVILGCTHFIYLSDLIGSIYSPAVVSDGVSALVDSLSVRFFSERNILPTRKKTVKLPEDRFLGVDGGVNYKIFQKMTAFC